MGPSVDHFSESQTSLATDSVVQSGSSSLRPPSPALQLPPAQWTAGDRLERLVALFDSGAMHAVPWLDALAIAAVDGVLAEERAAQRKGEGEDEEGRGGQPLRLVVVLQTFDHPVMFQVGGQ